MAYKTANPLHKTAKLMYYALYFAVYDNGFAVLVFTDTFAVPTHKTGRMAYKTANPLHKTAKLMYYALYFAVYDNGFAVLTDKFKK